MSRVKPKKLDTKRGSTAAVSKDGYSFKPSDDHWRLNKDDRVPPRGVAEVTGGLGLGLGYDT